MPRILVFGAGSIGAVYVYLFMKAGATVTALCRSNYDAVNRDGFTIHSVRLGNVHCKPNVVRTVDEAASSEPWDFLVICNKFFPGSSPSLSDMIRPAVGPSTAIVLFQNGIAIEEEVAAAFPENPILSGVVYVPATQIRPGVIDCGTQVTTWLRLAHTPHQHRNLTNMLLRKLLCLYGKGVQMLWFMTISSPDDGRS
jgi:2-dehydropantoate 2-reductase